MADIKLFNINKTVKEYQSGTVTLSIGRWNKRPTIMPINIWILRGIYLTT